MVQKMKQKINHKSKGYFEGFYLKHTSRTQTLALIPSVHIDESGNSSASLQIITDTGSWQRSFPKFDMHSSHDAFYISMGDCTFTQHGLRLHIEDQDLTLSGRLLYGPPARLKYDIMGPFRWLPAMQCRHLVYSMLHRVNGTLTLNGKDYIFRDSTGYIEGDRGCSFPEKYLWTQYNNNRISIFMAAASIPVCKSEFNGCIACIWHKEKELRLATYLGARIAYADSRKLVLRQKDLVLSVELLNGQPQAHPLLAPECGGMSRWIKEKPACRVRYQLRNGDKVLFDFKTERGSFEGEW